MRHICEDERADYEAERCEARGIHPALRSRPEPETGKCRACGQRFLIDELSEDCLCASCDAAVKEMEEGRI